MKILLTSTLALGAICVLALNQPAAARGGHAGGHGFESHAENRGEGSDASRGREAAENHAAASEDTDRSAAAEDRVHTIENNANRDNNLRNADDEWGGGYDGAWGCAAVNENGECIATQ